MTKEEFIEKIKEIKINIPNEEFFLEYNRAIYNILDENERLKEENYKLQARADKYKNRNDKAVKYLKKNACYDEQENYFNDSLPEICCKPMLEILKGEDNE